MPQSRLFLPLVVLTIAALSYWLSGTQTDKAKDVSSTVQDNPDAFMEEVVTRVMDPEGLPRYELRSPRLTHYPLDNRTQMEQPRITLFRPHQGHWQLEAESATALQGDDELQLHGKVLIQRVGADQATELEIQTSELHVYPEQDMAETQALTTLSHATGKIQSQGMRAYFKEENLQLLSQVRGHYEP